MNMQQVLASKQPSTAHLKLHRTCSPNTQTSACFLFCQIAASEEEQNIAAIDNMSLQLDYISVIWKAPPCKSTGLVSLVRAYETQAA